MSKLAFALVAPMLLAAASPADRSGELAWFNGQWRGSGTMFGAPSTAELNVTPALGGRFTELRYRAQGQRQSTAFKFEGAAFYQPSKSVERGWTGDWFDSGGAKHSITATATGEALTAVWGDAKSEHGRTLYRRQADGSLEIVDEVAAPEGWRMFARHVLQPAR